MTKKDSKTAKEPVTKKIVTEKPVTEKTAKKAKKSKAVVAKEEKTIESTTVGTTDATTAVVAKEKEPVIKKIEPKKSALSEIEEEVIEFGDKIVACINATYHYQTHKMVSFAELQNTVRHKHSKFDIEVVRSANNLEAHIEISCGKVKINFPRTGDYKVF